jgi:hypothetical protein
LKLLLTVFGIQPLESAGELGEAIASNSSNLKIPLNSSPTKVFREKLKL